MFRNNAMDWRWKYLIKKPFRNTKNIVFTGQNIMLSFKTCEFKQPIKS